MAIGVARTRTVRRCSSVIVLKSREDSKEAQWPALSVKRCRQSNAKLRSNAVSWEQLPINLVLVWQSQAKNRHKKRKVGGMGHAWGYERHG